MDARFFKHVEEHVIEYLSKMSKHDKNAKLTLFFVTLAKQIIPECLRLGDKFFTHMTVFGTMGKEDGELPLHFDEKDIISSVFHLGKVFLGGNTQYYNGTTAKHPGNEIHSVPFLHGNLQIGNFCDILHGVEYWVGQRCGIQLNIKRYVLRHFIIHGTGPYDKYRLTGYPQGPIIFF